MLFLLRLLDTSATGSLVRVLEEWDMVGGEIYAVYPAGRAAKVSARAFVDYVVGALGASVTG